MSPPDCLTDPSAIAASTPPVSSPGFLPDARAGRFLVRGASGCSEEEVLALLLRRRARPREPAVGPLADLEARVAALQRHQSRGLA